MTIPRFSRLTLPPYGKRHVGLLGTITLMLACGLWWLLWQQSRQVVQQPTVRTISAAELNIEPAVKAPFVLAQQGHADTAWGDSRFVLFDIRPADQFEQAHLAGARSLPLQWLQQATFPAETTIVIYSDNQSDLATARATLQKRPLAHLYLLSEPLNVLKERGYAVDVRP